MSKFTGLLQWYAGAGRAELPWRKTRDPYRILVSEFMLQQTQVDRVVPKFEDFVAQFADFKALAEASLADVLKAWKGLGYNSRAVRLKRIAEIVTGDYAGVLPQEAVRLRELPGMGPYTAAAVRAFAFELDDVALDTNIRRVTHRVVFGVEYPPKATQREVDDAARAMLPPRSAHDWNSALMDLGATICTARAPKCLLCPLQRSCAAAPVNANDLDRLRQQFAGKRSPQEALPFVQTTRFARGRIVDRLRELPPGAAISLLDLRRELEPVLPPHSIARMETTLSALQRDGIVTRDGESVALSE